MSSEHTKLRKTKGRFKARSRPASQFLGISRGTPKMRKKRLVRERCVRCLWNWEELKEGKCRMCYHNCSEYYHQEAPIEACAYFEYKIGERADR